MHNPQDDITNKMAQDMSDLTCEMTRTCLEKENYFASQFNLTPAEFKCLRLFIKKNSLSIKELTSQLNITPGRITHILTSLESKGFITRKIDQTDKRNVVVTLTNKSIPFLENLNDSQIRLHKDILEKIEPGKRDDVINAMNDLLKALKSWSDTKVSSKNN